MLQTSFTSQRFADWVTGLRTTPARPEALEKAADCVFDTISCAVAGHKEPAVDAFETAAKRLYKAGSSPVCLRDTQLSAMAAAAVNATSISIFDLDDGHRQAMGHPGAAVVPAVLAVAHELGSSRQDVLNAIVAGYEVAVRIGAAERRPSYHSGNYTCFGVAAAVGYLKGFSSAQIAQALGICAYHGSRVSDLTLSQNMGTSVKESIPWSVIVGMSSCELAEGGFTGPIDALDLPERFKSERMLKDFGKGFEIEGTYFKKVSCCRWIHSAIEAIQTILKENKIDPSDVTRAEVETFAQAKNLNNQPDPDTLESAQYSVPFTMALAATYGEEALMPLRQESLHASETTELAQKITVIETKDMNAHFPARVPAMVRVWTKTQEHSLLVNSPWGEASRPPNRDELSQKLRILAAPHLPLDVIEQMIESAWSDQPDLVSEQFSRKYLTKS